MLPVLASSDRSAGEVEVLRPDAIFAAGVPLELIAAAAQGPFATIVAGRIAPMGKPPLDDQRGRR